MPKSTLIVQLDKYARYFGYRLVPKYEIRDLRDRLAARSARIAELDIALKAARETARDEADRRKTRETEWRSARETERKAGAARAATPRPAGGEMVYVHDYSGGYEEYRIVQIEHNRRKLDKIWADETTLEVVARDLERHGLGRNGLCHGARNAFEVSWLRERLGGDIIGTDISPTAAEFEHMVVWDFQDENPDWLGRFDFVYTNSLDQAMEPQRALRAWRGQITPKGRIYIEHSMAHSVDHAGEMDPFGAHPMAMPYLFFQWGRGAYRLADIVELPAKKNKNVPAWIFVLVPDA